jgi:hypothetical protein
VTELTLRLARRIETDDPCWFTGLAGELVDRFWIARPGVNPRSYCSASWLGEAGPGERGSVPGWAGMMLEPLPGSLAGRFPAPEFAAVAARAGPAIAAAIARLEAGGAGAPVVRLVRSVHIVAARGPGYDCSHSEPGLPFSVLVSIPWGERHAGLRLAESLLHETMHLQLTLVESDAPIVGPSAGSGYSPWQDCERPAQGLLHGLYVFAAIHRWLAILHAAQSGSFEDRTYVERRMAEIEREAREVNSSLPRPGLTEFGRLLASGLLRGIEGRVHRARRRVQSAGQRTCGHRNHPPV